MAGQSSESAFRDPRFQPLIDGFRNGEVKRRDFLRRAVGLGLKSAAAYSLFNTTVNAQVAQRGVGQIKRYTLVRGEEHQNTGVRAEDFPTRAAGEDGIHTTTSSVGEEAQGPQQTTSNVGEEHATTLRGSVNGAPAEEEQRNPSRTAVGEEGSPPPQNATTMRGSINGAPAEEEQVNHPPPTIANVRSEEVAPTTMRGNVAGTRPEEEVMSTRAMGEEGNPSTAAAGEEGATTQAYGEEGLQEWTPSTRRAGEEQAPPPSNPTTAGQGEEAYSQMVGEDPVTIRSREEFNNPGPRPSQPVYSAQAIGEEGPASGASQPLPPGIQLAPGEVLVDPGFVQPGGSVQYGPVPQPGVIIDGGSIVPSQTPLPTWNGFRRWKTK